MSAKKEIQDALLEARKLSVSTLKTYTSLLTSIQRSLKGEDHGIAFFSKSVPEIIDFVKTKEKAQSRKTILSALFVLTKDSRYSDAMRVDMKTVNDQYAAKRLSPERKEKTLSIEQVRVITKQICARFLIDKTERRLNDCLIALFMSGAVIPPRRLEWAFVKLRNYDSTDNFLQKNTVFFNKYKTFKIYGTQSIEIPKELQIWVKRILKFKTREFLLLNDRGKPYTTSALSKKVSSLYGCSIDLLRSTYINDVVYKGDQYQKMQEAAKDMGNSVEAQQSFYIKNG